jgi:hypothetical protein
MKNKNLGMKVEITFKKDSPFNGSKSVYRNVTEIHYRYRDTENIRKVGVFMPDKVAFESNIHSNGITQPIGWIEEFEAIIETEKAKEF